MTERSHSAPPGTPPDGRGAVVSHATWLSIAVLLRGWRLPEASRLRACDWIVELAPETLTATRAVDLLEGASVALPSCPACLMFIDLALSIRAAADAERVNEELNAARRSHEAKEG